MCHDLQPCPHARERSSPPPLSPSCWPWARTSAQIAHAEFFAEHGFALIDFAWYAGTQPVGYSLIVSPLTVLIGVKATGILAATVSTALLAWLFTATRYRAR